MMERQKDKSAQVTSAVRRTEEPRATQTRTGPHHATRGNPSLTQKARGQKQGTNATSLTQHPRTQGLSESNTPVVATRQLQTLTKFDKYLVVEGNGGTALSRLSPFAIQKYFYGVESITRLRSGDYLIATISESQSKHILERKRLGDCLISVRPHKSLNEIKGVIESDALKNDVTKEEIIEDLENYGVVDCYFHQKRLQNGQSENNGRVTLTFKGQTLPNRVTIAGWLHCRVRTYVPNPLRCFKCQKYGHSAKYCKRDKRCSNCGDGECLERCANPPQCVNCGGEHAASDRNCPQWILEKDIQKIKVQQNISYKEAKNQAMANRTTSSRSYAEAAQSDPQGGSQHSSEIAGVLQALSKQMELLQRQINVISQKVGVNVEEQETTEEESQNSKIVEEQETTDETSQNSNAKNQQRKRSLTKNGATSSSEELTAKRRSVETKDDSMAEADFSDEDMTKLLTTKWHVADDGSVIPRSKESDTTVAVKPKNGPQSNSGHSTTANKSAANAASGVNKKPKGTPKKVGAYPPKPPGWRR